MKHEPLADSVASATCPHADRCSGCALIDLPYEAQLASKTARVAAAVARYPALSPLVVEPTLPADPVTRYRTRAKWSVSRGRVGLFAKGGGHEVVDLPGCLVVPELVSGATAAVRSALRDAPTGAWERWIAALDIRATVDEGREGTLVTLVVERAHAPSIEVARASARALMERDGGILGVALNVRPNGAAQLLGPETTPLAGVEGVWDTLGRSRTWVTFGAFAQAHRGQAGRIHDAVREEARRANATRVLDLYGGSGSLALAVCAPGVEVDLVESFAPAARAAERAAKEAGVALRAIAGDSGERAAALVASGATYDLVIVNPPRRGLSPGVRVALATLAPRAIYVSCDPATLARDLDHLARMGMKAERVQPLDMIPLTAEVECAVSLASGAIPPARVLFDAGDAVFVDKGPHEPTTPQGEYAVSLLSRVRLLPGFELAVPVHRLDIGTSGVCLFAKTPEVVRGWSLALTAGGKTYRALVRGMASRRGVIKRGLQDDGRTQEACTRYRRLEVLGGHTLLDAFPEQGRTHQIRRHFAGIGHAIVGDERYGHEPTNRHLESKTGLDRTFLHCARIKLKRPGTEQELVIESPEPGDLAAVRAALATAVT